ncbi:MAG: CubicO group peptidase (beta-lactamase class C family) [Candidatus Azotimanducaceae bacterium]|jgi:CubicO group peptidase (beta-lactamase class C family)
MRISVLLFFLVGFQFCHAAELKTARPESVGLSTERLERIKPFMQTYVDNNQLAGVVTLIARKGKVAHFESVGKLNLVTGEALTKDSLFRIYSMTKPVVTAAAMILYEQGKFQLTDPVEKYLPEFKDAKVWVEGELVNQDHAFTIRELMSHTAGLTYGIFGASEVDAMYREALFDPSTRGYKQKTIEGMVTAMADLPLLHQPGSQWTYSLSADVLGRLIEVLSGQSLDNFFQANIFDPLGMKDTFFAVPKDKIARLGTNHMRDKEGKLIVIETPEKSGFTGDVTFFSGGGGLVSTAMDYLIFSQMMLNNGSFNGHQVLGRKTIELMTTNQLSGGASAGFGEQPGVKGTVGFGLGFAVITDQPKTVLGSIGEYSWGGAAGTIFWIDPKEELIGILMVQMMANPHDLRSQFKVLTDQAIID